MKIAFHLGHHININLRISCLNEKRITRAQISVDAWLTKTNEKHRTKDLIGFPIQDLLRQKETKVLLIYPLLILNRVASKGGVLLYNKMSDTLAEKL